MRCQVAGRSCVIRLLVLMMLIFLEPARGAESTLSELAAVLQSGGDAAVGALEEVQKRATEDPIAANIAGLAHYNGFGAPIDKARAVALWRQSSDQGNSAARMNLAEHYWNLGDEPTACAFYVDAASDSIRTADRPGGNVEAARALTRTVRCLEKNFVNAPFPGAAELFRTGAARAGDGAAILQVAGATGDAEVSSAQRNQMLLRLLEVGSPLHQAMAAMQFYRDGRFDPSLLLKLARKSASGSDPLGCFMRGFLLMAGFDAAAGPAEVRESFECAAREPGIKATSLWYLALFEVERKELRFDDEIAVAIRRAWDAGAVEIWDLAFELGDSQFLAEHPTAEDCRELCEESAHVIAAVRATKREMERLQILEAEQRAQHVWQAQNALLMKQAKAERRRAFWGAIFTGLIVGAGSYAEGYAAHASASQQPRIEIATAPTPSAPPAPAYFSFSRTSQSQIPASRTSASVLAQGGCRYDVQCGIGKICVNKNMASGLGRCMTPVDEYGSRTEAATVAQCSLAIDCPPGFECRKNPSHVNGICVQK